MMSEALAAIRRSDALILDTNMVLLDVVAHLDPQLVPRFKRTQQFSTQDALILAKLVESARELRTTPHVLTETSNLLGQLPGEHASFRARAILAQRVKVWSEELVDARSIASEHGSSHYIRFGLTDAVLVQLARHRMAVLTVDLQLYNAMIASDGEAINFNHLRPQVS